MRSDREGDGESQGDGFSGEKHSRLVPIPRHFWVKSGTRAASSDGEQDCLTQAWTDAATVNFVQKQTSSSLYTALKS